MLSPWREPALATGDVITSDPAEFLAACARRRLSPRAPATARAAFLVAPAASVLAIESARDNRYMDLSATLDPPRALAQHADLARLIGEDVPVVTFPGDASRPDGVFPNNAFATAPGRFIVGRMRHDVRRREASRSDIRAFFGDVVGYRTIDLSHETFAAELTGSLVIDRARGIGYCGLSERCDPDGARAMHEAFGLALTFCFALADGEYHTNVVMALLAGRLALIAPDGFADPRVPEAIAASLEDRVVWLSRNQKNAFAANAIALTTDRAWLSARGAASLGAAELAAIERARFRLNDVALDEIEKAGGSLRCCIAEIF